MQASSAVTGAAKQGIESRLATQLGELLRALLLHPGAEHLSAIEGRDLSLTQVKALLLLSASPKPIAAGALAEHLGVSPAAMSRALDSLVSRRYARRRECSEDRRVRLVSIAARGRDFVDEYAELRNAGLESFVASLDEEQRAKLADALTAIVPDEDGEAG
jgi:DNA-binding MarR family transcriptional regulator